MELTRERLVWGGISAIAVMGLGLYSFLYSPLSHQLSSAHRECSAIESEVLHAQDSISSLKLRPPRKGLIAEEEISQAIDELTKGGKSKGVNFISITPRQIEDVKESSHKACPIDIEIESTYEQLGTFLGVLDELGNSIVTITNFNIISAKEGLSKLKTKLTLTMYISN